MNEHMIQNIFHILFISCVGVPIASKAMVNNLLLIWTFITTFVGFAAAFVDATGMANVWYYIPLNCIVAGFFSYLYLQQYGKR